MNERPALSLRGVVVPGIEGRISFDVGATECVAICDPDPARTVLLQVIGGVLPPLRGTVRAGSAGALWQDDGLPEDIPVIETVRARLAAAGSTHAAEALLVDVRLGHRAGHDPWAMSVGERRRLASALVLAGQAEVVVLDEPERGLDRRSLNDLARRIRVACADGRAVLLATNDAGLADACGDYVIENLDELAGL